jgi:hypothetical protein
VACVGCIFRLSCCSSFESFSSAASQKSGTGGVGMDDGGEMASLGAPIADGTSRVADEGSNTGA